MEYVHESVKKDHYHPARVFISGVRSVQRHWHNSVEVLLFLEGELSLEQTYTSSAVAAGDLVVINSNIVHSLQAISQKNMVLTVQLPKSFFASVGIDVACIHFDLSSKKAGASEILAMLKSQLAEIALTQLQENKYYNAKLGELTHKLVYFLSLYFAVPRTDYSYQRELDKLSLAITEIQTNYPEHLTLQAVAEVQGLSRNYFAQYFKKHMGVTFLEYLNSVRLEHAHNDLTQTKKNITNIALDNGFPNSKSFSKSFKDLYKDSPLAYRKKHTEGTSVQKKPQTSISYFDLEGESKYQILYRYLLPNTTEKQLPAPTQQVISKIDTSTRGKKYPQNTLSLLTFGRASTGLSSALQTQLAKAQKDIGFQFARFHGILDDDMDVYREDEQGQPYFNFFRINALLDFMLSINLRPLLELSFMPSLLANESHTLWQGKSHLAMPKDIHKWNLLIRALVDNFVLRYGLAEVLLWKFEIWNEPEYFGIMWNDTANDYYNLWTHTFRTIKAVSSQMCVGGPSTFISTVCDSTWFDDFVQHCEQTATVPDFLSVHFYPIKGLQYNIVKDKVKDLVVSSKKLDYQAFNDSLQDSARDTGIKLSENVNELHDNCALMTSALQKKQWGHLPVYLTEWNHTVWQRDLIGDTIYKSAYLAKNFVDNLGTFEGMGHWTISDLMEELPLANDLFHGGLGLVTSSGIPKAGYRALSLLSRLGDVLLQKGDHYAVFKCERGIQVLLYYYTHINNAYQRFDASHIHPTSRYNVFMEKANISIQLFLQIKQAGNYRIKETKITRESGSAYDKWVAMGAPAHLSALEQEELSALSTPSSHISFADLADEFTLSKTLSPLDVVLVELTPTENLRLL